MEHTGSEAGIEDAHGLSVSASALLHEGDVVDIQVRMFHDIYDTASFGILHQ